MDATESIRDEAEEVAIVRMWWDEAMMSKLWI